MVDIDTKKLFFSARTKPHIDYISVVWDGCSDVLKKKFSAQRSCKVNLSNLITDQKLKEMRIMSLQKQQQMKYNKGLFMYRVLNNEGPEYTSNLYANTPSHSRNCQLSFTMMPQSMHLTCTQILPHALKNISLVCLGQG